MYVDYQFGYKAVKQKKIIDHLIIDLLMKRPWNILLDIDSIM